MSESVLQRIDAAGVAWLSLNRPEIHNAFDDVLIRQLTVSLQDLAADPGVRVVVLGAVGKSFSAGADLNWMRRMADYSYQENLADAMALAGLLKTLDELAKPVVARVQGAAFGGGVGLLAACDIVLVSERARFALTEVRLGILPAVISPYVVRAIGERQARRYFVTAERFDAATALRLGLVHEVVADDALDARLERLLEEMAQNGPQAMVAAKDLACFVARTPAGDAQIEDTARRIAEIRASDEGREGLAAFLEKRTPVWRGAR